MAKLVDLLQADRLSLENPVLLDNAQERRFVAGGRLAHLEANLFRPSAQAWKQKEASEDAIRIVSLKNPRQELAYAAGEITRAVRQEGRRYRDFAIVCASGYLPLQCSGSHGRLPFTIFLDVKAEIVFHPMIEFIYGLLMVLEENFSYESIMRLLRTGLSDPSVDEIDRLENYLLASGIRGRKKYSEPFYDRAKRL